MHYDYIVETQTTISDYNRETSHHLTQTKKVRDKLVTTRGKIEAEIQSLNALITKLEEVGRVGQASVRQLHATSVQAEEPATDELERSLTGIVGAALESDQATDEAKAASGK